MPVEKERHEWTLVRFEKKRQISVDSRIKVNGWLEVGLIVGHTSWCEYTAGIREVGRSICGSNKRDTQCWDEGKGADLVWSCISRKLLTFLEEIEIVTLVQVVQMKQSPMSCLEQWSLLLSINGTDSFQSNDFLRHKTVNDSYSWIHYYVQFDIPFCTESSRLLVWHQK